jgi:actin
MHAGDQEEEEARTTDSGSGIDKTGLGGDESPQSVFPSIRGHPKNKQQIVDIASKDRFVSDKACSKAGVLILKHQIEHDIVTNWDDMEKIGHRTFDNELCLDSTQHPVLFTRRRSIRRPTTRR